MSIASIPHDGPVANVGNVAAGSIVGHAIWEGIQQNPLNSVLVILSIVWFSLQIGKFIYDLIKKEPPSSH